MERLLPRLRVEVGDDGSVDLQGPVPGRDRLWLEIGFGAGEHLAWQARARPDIVMIGAESWLNGVAALLARVEEDGLANVRVLDGDVRPLLDALPEAGLERIAALFPDPWPKARHAKRRLVAHGTARHFARLLTDDGELRLATDVADHALWMTDAIGRRPEFAPVARGRGDWPERPADWPETRYEAKARRQGRTPVFLAFRRLPRPGTPARDGSPAGKEPGRGRSETRRAIGGAIRGSGTP